MKFNRTIVLFFIFLITFWSFTNSTSLAFSGLEGTELEKENLMLEEVLLISEDQESAIVLYKDDEFNEVFTEIPNKSKVTLLDLAGENLLLVDYKGKDVDGTEIDIEAYVDGSLITIEEYNDNDGTDIEEEELDNSTEDDEFLLEDDSNKKTESEDSEQQVDEPDEDIEENQELSKEEEEESKSVSENPSIKPTSSVINKVSYNGVALKSKTHVYSKQSRNSKVLKSYSVGSILKYSSLNGNWYQAVVYIKGVATTGYIHQSDVDNAIKKQETLYGIVPKSNVNVYVKASKDSKKLKTYSTGSKLKYKTYTRDWYEATVLINGVATTGYIYKADVHNIEINQKVLHGIGQKSPTPIYSKAATNSRVIKSYSHGSILKYKTYTKDWYEATVYVAGKASVGYIHKSDVEVIIPSNKRTQHFDVALKDSTNVYSKASTESKPLKGYKSGSILKYTTFSNNWYEATVYVNGQATTGYIHKSHVGKPAKQESLRGIATQKTTQVYQQPFTSSRVLKGYSEGQVLIYKSYANSWYEAVVYINGVSTTGYIHKNHVENIASEQKRTEGKAKRATTNVYDKASKDSKVLKSYKAGSVLKFKTFTENWYEATVYVKGKPLTGYIHVSDISSLNGKVVYLDAGHGGSDPGSGGNGLREKDLTLDIAKRVKKQLESNGFIVIMSRMTDVYLTLAERTKAANDSNADIFVSVHINSFTKESASGIETWNMSKGPKPKESNILASEIQKETIKETKVNDRGVKDGNLHVNRESKMPSALVEVGFISNKGDAEKLKQASFKNKAAKGIANGIMSYFRLVH